jgi:16S rRNA (guanine966-N2)-methyltransferase
VTRIIAGAAGSLPLDVPPAGTRPTSDRVRESMFAALEAADALEGARVLDLFAGSGALGLEALSRGAASADLVEKAPRAARVAERNAQRIARATGSPARVHTQAADAFLRGRGEASVAFDLVFLDPPYEVSDDALLVTLGLLVAHLDADALVVIERAARSGAPTLPAGLEATRDKKYGDTHVWWARPA